MGGVEDFVRDGVFADNCHTLVFDNGETHAARAARLHEIDTICKAVGIAYVVRETIDSGQPGYEFGFADETAYAAFVFNVHGDLESPGGHVQTHVLDCTKEYRDAFRLAAETHLSALGIKYKWRDTEDGVQFAFDRFSDRMLFQALIKQGTIDASAQGLLLTRAMQQRIHLFNSNREGPAPHLG